MMPFENGLQMATMRGAPERVASESSVRRRADVRVHRLDDEGLVYDPRSSDTHHLNATAMFIWSRCDGLHTCHAMADALAGQFDVSERAAFEHVDRTIEEFHKRRLLSEDVVTTEATG